MILSLNLALWQQVPAGFYLCVGTFSPDKSAFCSQLGQAQGFFLTANMDKGGNVLRMCRALSVVPKSTCGHWPSVSGKGTSHVHPAVPRDAAAGAGFTNAAQEKVGACRPHGVLMWRRYSSNSERPVSVPGTFVGGKLKSEKIALNKWLWKKNQKFDGNIWYDNTGWEIFLSRKSVRFETRRKSYHLDIFPNQSALFTSSDLMFSCNLKRIVHQTLNIFQINFENYFSDAFLKIKKMWKWLFLLITFWLIDMNFSKSWLHQTFLMSNTDWTWPRNASGLGPAYSGLSHLWDKQRRNSVGQRMRWWREHVRKKVLYTWSFWAEI